MLEENKRARLLCSNPILCVESALSIHGIGTYSRLCPQVFGEFSTVRDVDFGSYIPNKFGDEDIVEKYGMKATTPLRSICEMIIFDRREDLIYEALDDMINMEKMEVSTILEAAKKYGVLEKMQHYINTLDENIDFY